MPFIQSKEGCLKTKSLPACNANVHVRHYLATRAYYQVTCDRYCIPGERLLNVCAHRKAVDRLLAKDEAAVVSSNSDTKMARTLPTYNYSLEMLFPASKKA